MVDDPKPSSKLAVVVSVVLALTGVGTLIVTFITRDENKVTQRSPTRALLTVTETFLEDSSTYTLKNIGTTPAQDIRSRSALAYIKSESVLTEELVLAKIREMPVLIWEALGPGASETAKPVKKGNHSQLLDTMDKQYSSKGYLIGAYIVTYTDVYDGKHELRRCVLYQPNAEHELNACSVFNSSR